MRKVLEIGGFIAGAVLVVFGIAAVVLAVHGNNTVNDNLKWQQITGTPDMTPAAIKTEATQSGLKPGTYPVPSCSVAGKSIDTGTRARCFAQYMQIHALEASGGFTYAQMGMYVAKPGTPKAQLTPDGATSNKAYAQIDPTSKQPVSNGARNVWVTETALTTALNQAYLGSQLSLFSIVVGVALILAGIGFIVLDFAALHRRREAAEQVAEPAKPLQKTTPAVV
ncbi:MAG TPA: hypothetical protein VLV28_03250 [Gaiellaceae bacterium]|nr:hypothetical protein [Gaiellaceae bacterium]